ncbi:hypothetical protein SAMN02745673_00868 [Marinactinospora thermotolerans DSM 45154]|uniref:Uncharacterized protein n=1 Tax=Marinactinospora thermotolerans DSM 45154 TaxID=1122192 RepID=A0A1T4LYB3_9ACTN|nr:hypothetical protein SAMN02745673_00868 [Marinactinospora thermotolerans DSM 45154]
MGKFSAPNGIERVAGGAALDGGDGPGRGPLVPSAVHIGRVEPPPVSRPTDAVAPGGGSGKWKSRGFRCSPAQSAGAVTVSAPPRATRAVARRAGVLPDGVVFVGEGKGHRGSIRSGAGMRRFRSPSLAPGRRFRGGARSRGLLRNARFAGATVTPRREEPNGVDTDVRPALAHIGQIGYRGGAGTRVSRGRPTCVLPLEWAKFARGDLSFSRIPEGVPLSRSMIRARASVSGRLPRGSGVDARVVVSAVSTCGSSRTGA